MHSKFTLQDSVTFKRSPTGREGGTTMNKLVNLMHAPTATGSMVNLLTLNPSLRELQKGPVANQRRRLMTAKVG